MSRTSKLKSRILAQLCALIISTSICQSGELSSARSLAMAGAMTALAGGVDAARFNPANLGLTNNSGLQLELASLGVHISNNVFTLADYNRYTGTTLSESDKSDILAKVPNEGLNFKANAEAAAMSVALGKFAFSVSGVGAADVNLNRDILELLLNDYSFGDSIVFGDSHSDAIAYAQAGLSYGHLLYEMGERQLTVGGTFKYIRGIGYEEITKLEGSASAQSTGYQGSGELVARTASGGTGYGVDLGAALKLNRHYTVGARIENVLGSINWNRKTEEHAISFSFDTLNGNFVSDDYTIDIPEFSNRLPAVMNLGLANTSGKLLWAVDWEQGFKRTAESSVKPRLSMGIEWLQLGIVPLRLGFSSGGGRGESFSLGSGVAVGPYYFDFAAVTGTGISAYSAKGLKLALSTGIRL